MASASGQTIPSFTLDLAHGYDAKDSYLKYELTNVRITGYSIGGTGQGEIPTESISLNFEEIRFTYNSSRGDRIESYWNSVTNSGG